MSEEIHTEREVLMEVTNTYEVVQGLFIACTVKLCIEAMSRINVCSWMVWPITTTNQNGPQTDHNGPQ